jgi:phenylalanyl-tRNA synthetase beta chain
MKFTLSWLKDHLDTDATVAEIADTLTMIGLEVEDVIDAARDLAPFTVAHVVSAEQHPNADKLRVCVVDTGAETVQVVCGAPNARAGMKGVFAPSGTRIPGTGLDLKPTTIRGVESNGMLCSEREMGLSDEHQGIIDLPADTPVGVSFAQVMGLDDPVIDVAVTPNRPDCLGVRGIARDLAAAGLGTLRPDTIEPVAGRFDSPVGVVLDFDPATANACPAFAGRYVRGVKNGPSPDWLQRRLRAVGLRPINALVDITNFVSLDRARPLHVFDADKLTGDVRPRLGREGERFLALDGREYEVDEAMCVIADDAGPLGLGGIMGGEASGCTGDTVNVFIESALFDPLRTAATGRRLGIDSDARYRFERGVDPAFMVPGAELATRLVVEFCGGEPGAMVVAGTVPEPAVTIDFDPAEVERLTGVASSAQRIADILTSLGYACEESSGRLSVRVPTWRPDVHGKADLVEEIVRIHGIDAFPPVPMDRGGEVAKPVLTTGQQRRRWSKRTLAARGMVEAVTWSFIPRPQARIFGGGGDDLELANPISSEMSSMRPSLLPGLLAAAQRNHDRGFADVALFEVGQAYRGDRPEDQYDAASGVRTRTAKLSGVGRHWSGAATGVDLFDAKADALAVLAALGAPVDKLQAAAEAPAWFHPGRSGVLRLGPKNILAAFGEVHPRVLDAMDVDGPVAAFEVFIDAIPVPKARPGRSRPPLEASDLQPVRRDFAFVVDDAVTADTLIRAARGADRTLIAAVDLFDVFAGCAMGEGRKSLAIEVTLQPVERTLTDEEIDKVSRAVIAAVEKATGGTLRG